MRFNYLNEDFMWNASDDSVIIKSHYYPRDIHVIYEIVSNFSPANYSITIY